MTPQVSIIMGSVSDLPVMNKAAQFLDEMEIPFEMNALSAHRTPEEVERFARGAEGRGIRVIIAAAGMAAHLCGFRVEVDVGHEGRMAAQLVESTADEAEVTGLAYALGCEADVFGAGACHADRLNDGRIRVHGRYVGHGLDAYGVIPAQRGVTNGDYRGRSSFQFVLNLNWTLANSSLALTIFFLSPSL